MRQLEQALQAGKDDLGLHLWKDLSFPTVQLGQRHTKSSPRSSLCNDTGPGKANTAQPETEKNTPCNPLSVLGV